jgi:hypothetical protein
LILTLNEKSSTFLNKILEESPNNDLFEKIENSVKLIETTIISEIKNNTLHDKLKSNIDEKINSIILSYSNITNEFKNNTINGEKSLKNLENLLHKFLYSSSSKGNLGEIKLFNLINNLFPNADNIENTTGCTAKGDIIMERRNKPTIMFENKEYANNVPKQEVEKFIRDVNQNNCSGIFISNKSGIAGKYNYEIEINNKNILIYIHNAEYNDVIIKTAVDIIDNLYDRIKNIDTKNNLVSIELETLKIINTELNNFADNKKNIIEDIKKNQKALIKTIEDLQLPYLNNILSKHFSASQNIFKCRYDCCSSYETLKQLTAHERKHSNAKESIVHNFNYSKTIKKETKQTKQTKQNKIIQNNQNNDNQTDDSYEDESDGINSENEFCITINS